MSGARPTRGWVTDGDLSAREHFVYRAFDAAGALLYIGRTKHPRRRWVQHQKAGAPWVPLTASCRMTGPLDYVAAHRLESELIASGQPRFNRRGLRGTADPRSFSTVGGVA